MMQNYDTLYSALLLILLKSFRRTVLYRPSQPTLKRLAEFKYFAVKE